MSLGDTLKDLTEEHKSEEEKKALDLAEKERLTKLTETREKVERLTERIERLESIEGLLPFSKEVDLKVRKEFDTARENLNNLLTPDVKKALRAKGINSPKDFLDHPDFKDSPEVVEYKRLKEKVQEHEALLDLFHARLTGMGVRLFNNHFSWINLERMLEAELPKLKEQLLQEKLNDPDTHDEAEKIITEREAEKTRIEEEERAEKDRIAQEKAEDKRKNRRERKKRQKANKRARNEEALRTQQQIEEAARMERERIFAEAVAEVAEMYKDTIPTGVLELVMQADPRFDLKLDTAQISLLADGATKFENWDADGMWPDDMEDVQLAKGKEIANEGLKLAYVLKISEAVRNYGESKFQIVTLTEMIRVAKEKNHAAQDAYEKFSSLTNATSSFVNDKFEELDPGCLDADDFEVSFASPDGVLMSDFIYNMIKTTEFKPDGASITNEQFYEYLFPNEHNLPPETVNDEAKKRIDDKIKILEDFNEKVDKATTKQEIIDAYHEAQGVDISLGYNKTIDEFTPIPGTMPTPGAYIGVGGSHPFATREDLAKMLADLQKLQDKLSEPVDTAIEAKDKQREILNNPEFQNEIIHLRDEAEQIRIKSVTDLFAEFKQIVIDAKTEAQVYEAYMDAEQKFVQAMHGQPNGAVEIENFRKNCNPNYNPAGGPDKSNADKVMEMLNASYLHDDKSSEFQFKDASLAAIKSKLLGYENRQGHTLGTLIEAETKIQKEESLRVVRRELSDEFERDGEASVVRRLDREQGFLAGLESGFTGSRTTTPEDFLAEKIVEEQIHKNFLDHIVSRGVDVKETELTAEVTSLNQCKTFIDGLADENAIKGLLGARTTNPEFKRMLITAGAVGYFDDLKVLHPTFSKMKSYLSNLISERTDKITKQKNFVVFVREVGVSQVEKENAEQMKHITTLQEQYAEIIKNEKDNYETEAEINARLSLAPLKKNEKRPVSLEQFQKATLTRLINEAKEKGEVRKSQFEQVKQEHLDIARTMKGTDINRAIEVIEDSVQHLHQASREADNLKHSLAGVEIYLPPGEELVVKGNEITILSKQKAFDEAVVNKFGASFEKTYETYQKNQVAELKKYDEADKTWFGRAWQSRIGKATFNQLKGRNERRDALEKSKALLDQNVAEYLRMKREVTVEIPLPQAEILKSLLEGYSARGTKDSIFNGINQKLEEIKRKKLPDSLVHQMEEYRELCNKLGNVRNPIGGSAATSSRYSPGSSSGSLGSRGPVGLI